VSAGGERGRSHTAEHDPQHFNASRESRGLIWINRIYKYWPDDLEQIGTLYDAKLVSADSSRNLESQDKEPDFRLMLSRRASSSRCAPKPLSRSTIRSRLTNADRRRLVANANRGRCLVRVHGGTDLIRSSPIRAPLRVQVKVCFGQEKSCAGRYRAPGRSSGRRDNPRRK